MRYLLTLALLAVAAEAHAVGRPRQAPRPPQAPPVRVACVCGTSCSCAPGSCPTRCPVAVQPVQVPASAPARVFVGWRRVCDNGVCRFEPVYR